MSALTRQTSPPSIRSATFLLLMYRCSDYHKTPSSTYLRSGRTAAISVRAANPRCTTSTERLSLISTSMASDLPRIFNLCASGDQVPPFELPNQRIEVKVKLTKHVDSVLRALQNDLRQHNMDKVSLDAGTRNVIAVSGIPPVNGFDRHTVLAIVQRHDPGATLLA